MSPSERAHNSHFKQEYIQELKILQSYINQKTHPIPKMEKIKVDGSRWQVLKSQLAGVSGVLQEYAIRHSDAINNVVAVLCLLGSA